MNRTSTLMLGPLVASAMLAAHALAVPAWGAEPLGEWLVEGGMARVKIDNCGGKLWGVVSWEKKPGGLDTKNPDKAKRTRPTLGMPVLLGMKLNDPRATDPVWEGEIYNGQNGKTYSAEISLAKADVLRVEGCVMGILCGGQDWTRVKPDPATAATTNPNLRAATPKPAPARPHTAAPAAAPSTTAHAPLPPSAEPGTMDVCAVIPGAPGVRP